MPLISNVGCEFSIKPVNYFDQLASLDVVDSDDFASCAAEQGQGAFDYTYTADGSNTQFQKAGFKVTGPLNSRDIYQPSPAVAATAALAPGLVNAG